MTLPNWLEFFERPFPSANTVLVKGKKPILVDSGFGSDIPATKQWLFDKGVLPEKLSLLVNTHYHSDHVGGNSSLQEEFLLPVAAHRWEAGMVNSRDRETGTAQYLDQPIEPYQVNLLLDEGDQIDAGELRLEVIHTPGHTCGHVCLYEPTEQILICGDVLQSNDVGWINPFREGIGGLQQAMTSVEKLQKLDIRQIVPGHGPVIDNPVQVLDAVLRRYEKWQTEPLKMAWHGCKRIFAYQLMIRNGMAEHELENYLLGCAWFYDYSHHFFNCTTEDFVQPFLSEMLRSGAAEWSNGKLMAKTPYISPPPAWLQRPARPLDWPKL